MRISPFVLPALAVGALAAACGSDASGPSPATAPGDAGADARAEPLCVDGKPARAYPAGPYEVALLGTLPELSFEGENGPVRLADYFEPCAPRSRLLVIRTSALWCGTCGWQTAHTRALLGDPSFADRIELLDLLVADEDNLPATPAGLARLRARLDAPGALGIDPAFTFRDVASGFDPLPTYVIVDTRTMTVRTTDTNPNPTELRGKLLVELALLDHQPRPRVDVAPTLDGLLTENEVDLLRAMKAPGAPPPDPTNAYGDLPAAAALGKRLFSDAGLSPSGKVACATCHDASKGLSDGLPQSVGVARTSRNAPSVALAAHSRWQFWDGRADTLWAQALGPLESAKEHGSSRLFVAHRIAEAYAAEYAAVFPAHPLPDLSDGARFPPAGAPGDAAWKGMAGADQNAVTRVFVDVGKAIAAFERTLRVMPNALDRYAGGDVGALSAAEKQGLYVFFKTGCPQCHYGPRLTDDAFHALRFPTGAADGAPDRGRADGAPKLLSAEFTAASPWSDAPAAARSFLGLDGPPPSMVGAFKTPTLRGLPTSGPYGHGGTFATLDEVTKHYGERGLPDGDPRAVGVTEAWVPRFDVHAQHDLVAFLRVLTADLAQ